jgi:hypothetical protein
MNDRNFARLVSFLAAAAVVCAACSQDRVSGPPTPTDIPASVAIPATDIVSGVQIGPQTGRALVDAFHIAKHPVTVAQFKDCVAAGACASPQEKACMTAASPPFDRATVNMDGADQLPATCVGVAQARAFCSWVGGRLPNISQFMLAGRGTAVARFPWGNTYATCEQRADAAPRRLTLPPGSACGSGDPLRDYSIGGHPAGASPLGVEDVLLSPGELLDASADAWSSACAQPFNACVAYGLVPGAIDAFEPVEVDDAVANHAYGFRCIWN